MGGEGVTGFGGGRHLLLPRMHRGGGSLSAAEKCKFLSLAAMLGTRQLYSWEVGPQFLTLPRESGCPVEPGGRWGPRAGEKSALLLDFRVLRIGKTNELLAEVNRGLNGVQMPCSWGHPTPEPLTGPCFGK